MKGMKTGGRKKGTPNKKSHWLREDLERNDVIWSVEFKNALETKDYEAMDRLIALLPYLNPKMKEMEAPSAYDADANESADILELIK